MRRTIPQIIMLNHGMWWNREKAGLNDPISSSSERDSSSRFNGKKVEDCSTDELMTYMGAAGGYGVVS